MTWDEIIGGPGVFLFIVVLLAVTVWVIDRIERRRDE